MKRTLLNRVALLAMAAVVIALGSIARSQSAAPPTFRFDPTWPKELPNNWLVGNVVGVAVDSKDNVWITHRPASQAGAEKTPPVLAFDQAGNIVRSWGGSGGTGYEWGTQAHGLYVDYKDNVWVGFGGGLPYDIKSKATTDNAHILKFTPEGKFLLQLGKFGQGTEGSNSTTMLGQPTDIAVDPKTDEVYITDGYTNRRVIVFDANTGAYKRHWGAFGQRPEDGPVPAFNRATPRKQFDTPHCAALANDGQLYICDRGNQRIQVFQKDGKFVKDALITTKLADGSMGGTPWDIAFSTDPQQTFIYLADGGNHRVHTLRRDTLEVVASFGRRGRFAGQLRIAAQHRH